MSAYAPVLRRLLFAALLCLAVPASVLSQAADDVRVSPSKERTFRIPFQTQAGERRLREVQLYTSTDQGRTWRQAATAAPEQGFFNQFTAPQDGTYWFAVRTVDLQNRLNPPTDDGLRAGLKVLVDTVRPTVQLRALAPKDGHVGVEWDVRDDNLDVTSLRVEYVVQGGAQWTPVRAEAVAAGQTYWAPMTNAPLEVRLTAKDTVGNEGEARVVVGPAGVANPANPVQPNVAVQPAPGNPPVRMVNSKRISLNYRLDDVGPSGAVVELWYTKDGRSWQKYGEDPNPRPPFVFDVHDEGVFGFTLVVRSGVGIGDKPPQVGDPPQLWVEVDTTKPVVKLQNVDVGRGIDAGNMTITWTASDKNLGTQPITLSYAEQVDGPWTPIIQNLENRGRYVWRMPPNGVPFKLLVRVEAADKAGNIGVAQSAEHVKVDLAKPKVSILDVGSAGKQN
ncbi:MAG: hypothetical protein K2R98_11410 [Gemmataceae bacterium]|nr:hypothetical protein [Gemmataceae bacterium]